MTYRVTTWPRVGERSLADRADRASEDLRRYRDLRFVRGSSESYQLTGQLAELAVASRLLSLPAIEQQEHVEQLINDAADYLRYLRRGCDA